VTYVYLSWQSCVLCFWIVSGLAATAAAADQSVDQPANQPANQLPTPGRSSKRSSSRATSIRGAAPVGANLITVGRGADRRNRCADHATDPELVPAVTGFGNASQAALAAPMHQARNASRPSTASAPARATARSCSSTAPPAVERLSHSGRSQHHLSAGSRPRRSAVPPESPRGKPHPGGYSTLAKPSGH